MEDEANLRRGRKREIGIRGGRGVEKMERLEEGGVAVAAAVAILAHVVEISQYS